MSFAVFRDANSLRVFWGQLLSQSCDKLMTVGLIWVLSSDFNVKWVPLFIALGALPHFLFASKSGFWISKWGELKTIIWTDLGRGLLFLLAALISPVLAEKEKLLLLLMLLTFISNLAGALFNPAILSLPVLMMRAGDLRDKLTALIDSCFSWGNVLGPLVSALVYAQVGLPGLFLINGLSYLFSAYLAVGIKIRPLMSQSADGAIQDDASLESMIVNASISPPRTVFELLRKQTVISGMLFTFLLMNLFLAPLMIFMPWYAKNVYGDGIAGLAKLEFFLGIGTVMGSILLSLIRLPGSIWLKVAFSLCLMSVSYLSFTFSHTVWQGAVAVLFLGFFLAIANVTTLTFFQSAPEAQDVPAVMGLVNLISVASLPLSMGVLAAFIEKLSVPALAAASAGIVIVLAFYIPFIPGIRRV
ncbi:MAG: MFS transporter [Candidatus Obscuribacterales bacterium]|nr:MFS transporter [Candidatus Obscuribacterales bacterium]